MIRRRTGHGGLDGEQPLFAAVLAAAILVSFAYAAHADTGTHETIVLFRHGEKPARGLGQLDCQGLNRALALAPVLLAKFGRPDYLFAPDPAHQLRDLGIPYSYVRPLATIEPTAIRLGLPVNTQFGFEQIDRLQAELLQPRYHSALVFVAWEHLLLDEMTKHIIAATGGDPALVPAWPGNDYDGMFVVRIAWDQGRTSVAFRRETEGLDHLSTACPTVP